MNIVAICCDVGNLEYVPRMASCWSTVFDFHEDLHVTLKPYHTAKAYYMRENKRWKKLRSASIF